jgi:tetratricopeptide (TPR) repeat protein
MARQSVRMMMLVMMMTAWALVSGCSGHKGGSNPPTVEQGWQLFTAESYTQAIAEFEAVLAADTSNVEAYVGLGWSYAFADKLDSAANRFEDALAHNASLIDVHAGLSAVQLARGDRDGAITHANMVLVLDSTWAFVHYPGVDYLDVHLILAQAYFGKGGPSYAMAQAEVDYLDPTNGLNPVDSATWGVHPTYAAALLSEIQKIEESVGSEIVL